MTSRHHPYVSIIDAYDLLPPDRGSVDSGFEELDFLFPNGITISKECDRESTLADVKSAIWEQAIQKPGSKFLRDSGKYVFIGRTCENTEQEFDDKVKVSDLRLVSPVLEVSEPICSRDIRKLYEKTDFATGVSVQAINRIDCMCPEQKRFRAELANFCRNVIEQIENWSVNQKLDFFHPAKLDLNKDLPLCTERKLIDAKEMIPEIKVLLVEKEKTHTFTVAVHCTSSPSDIIEAVIIEWGTITGQDEETKTRNVKSAAKGYVLKVCGKEDYMLKNICIHVYEYIRHCINRDEVPVLQIVQLDQLIKNIPENKWPILQQGNAYTPTTEPICPPACTWSWDVSTDIHYCIKVRTQPGRKHQYVGAEMFIVAQLFNGEQPLSKPMKSHEKGFNVKWDFDIPVQSLPRTARLCFISFAVEKEVINTNKVKSVNWVNVQIFDHDGELKTGDQSVNVFDFEDRVNVSSYPQGTPGSNWDTISQALKYEVIVTHSKPIVYPSKEYINKIVWRERLSSITQDDRSANTLNDLDNLALKDPFYQMKEEEKMFLWKNRHFAMEYQTKLLPKIIDCVDWRDRHQVFHLHRLLAYVDVDKLTLTTVLQLLRPKCPDQRAREIAVSWLRKHLDPVLIELYLLQLVQILKFESYMNNEFVQFLLEKAIQHRSIGHKFFWLLRSEVNDPVARCRFATILEAYCLHCGSAVLDCRLKEVQALKVLSSGTKRVKTSSENGGDYQGEFNTWLTEETTWNALEKTSSTMHTSVMLDELRTSECRVMTSKMKPLWMSWTNQTDPREDKENTKVRYIVKKGDDLRQDMLVTQMLRFMDMLWKQSCHDYRTVIYDCLALDREIGLIEVVANAQTICDIEEQTKTSPHKCTSLHEWLYTSTTGTIGFTKAVERFRWSCAGFCIATFILGVGDRHSDNIMLTKTGEIFNIDFGHFLNHKKTKGYIERERTPFILTGDFVNLMTNGSKKKEKDPKFIEFMYLCFEAYMSIRRSSDLFLTLLNLMINANLPELSEIKDINYCRECLGVDKTEDEAAEFFLKKLFLSYHGQWSTKINWFIHRWYKNFKSTKSTS